jgi:single-strand DNA-binding protein
MNNFSGMGRLVADPEMRATQSGISVCNFRIAINRRFKNKETNEYDADFLSCVAWRGTAEFICKYFGKGDMIGIVGSVQTRSWDADDGTKRYATEIMVEQAHFSGSKRPSETGYGSSHAPDNSPAAPYPADYDAKLPFDI